jgi:hypothetical protein
MADSRITRGRLGFTAYTGDPSQFNGLSGIILRGSDGFDRALWFDTTGDLRTADVDAVEADAFNPDSSGAVVGGQS